MSVPARSRLHPADLLRVGAVGLSTRKLRAGLSALGIAIGIAAMVAVLGISESSRQDLLKSLDKLGTNLLTVQAGSGLGAGDAQLPASADEMIARIGPVDSVAATTSVGGDVRRTDFIPEGDTQGLQVKAADVGLLSALAGEMADGEWLDATRSDLPVVVLGSVAAERLGVEDVATGARVWIGDRWFTVVGVLEPLELAADIDRSALIGEGIARSAFDMGESPETVYVRADPEQVESVRAVAAATADPDNPDEVEVSRPSDAIEARAEAADAYTELFLGLGAVALLVGGVGIANIMVISVLERRSEIGLRRALGATRRHVSLQFVTEALFLSAAGGAAGVALGAAATATYALLRGWSVEVPAVAIVGGLASALVIGAIAGVYPARRAALLSPTEALRTV